MTHPDAALKLVLDSVSALPAVEAGLSDAVGMIAAEEVRASSDLPPFDNSAMDGYALRAGSAGAARSGLPVTLPVRRTARAGEGAAAVADGEACRIMTGAPLPPGADAVVMRERAEEEEGTVRLREAPEPGQHVRRRGEDIRRGESVLKPGAVIRPYEIGLLAAQGISRLKVVRRPRVAVLSSGDELVDFRLEPGPCGIRDSSSPALEAALREWGFEPLPRGIARDDKPALRRAIEAALSAADALLITGGVSVGDFDFTRAALDELGFSEIFWKAAIRPGKPLLYGLAGGKPVFGLPGNPISTLVCAEVFARPALDRMAGLGAPRIPFPHRGALAKAFVKPEALRQYLFCRAHEREGRVALEVVEPQGSARFAMAGKADALAVGPIGLSRLEPGLELEFRWI